MQTDREIVIIDIPSPGILGGVFSDLILALTHALSLLGVKVSYSRQFVETTKPVIVFGLYRAFINQPKTIQLPENYFIFNLSPVIAGTGGWFDHYVNCLKTHNLIDYSYLNIGNIAQSVGSARIRHLFDFGFIDLMPFAGFQRSDSYLFYGKLNEDRSRRLKQFQEAGVKLQVLQNVWGHERDIQIRTAKAIINIGKFNPNVLEVYRIWHSLCLETPVYSEPGVDLTLAERYRTFIHMTDHLDADALAAPAVSPDVYRKETDFLESTRSLLRSMQLL
jgi:hypothetical protein